MRPKGTGTLHLALCAMLGAGVAACDSPSTPPAPAALTAVAGDGQAGTAGAVLPVPPSVRVEDHRGRPVPDVPVSFSIAEGGGSIEVASASTDGSGIASPGPWTLGPKVGVNVLTASVGDLPAVRLTATSSAGAPAAIRLHAGGTQSTTVGERVPVAPAVVLLDALENPVPGAPVTFTITEGDGELLAAGATGSPGSNITTATDGAGVASVALWRLGTRAGSNALEVHADGVGTVIRIDALATPGPAALLTHQAGNDQVAVAGSRVPVAPSVHVTDTYGNPVPGVTVAFQVTGGGGSLAGAIQSTDGEGIAVLEAWSLGSVPGPNSLVAGIAGVGTVTFAATGTTATGGSSGSGSLPGGFTLELRYTTSLPASQMAAFDAAAKRWNDAIRGDLPDVVVTVSANGCGAPHPAVSENVDDIVIFITVRSIDGPGKVLGAAGPCRVRPGGGLPALGIVYLDADDLGSLESKGLLADVALHEMGHVLGIGTLWPSGLLVGAGGSDPVFTGSAAVDQFLAAGGSAYGGTPVPVENAGGGGTRDAHWREAVMASEIMTGWINIGGNPFSRVTVASLQDMGYQVDLGAADAFRLNAVSSLGTGGTLPGVRVIETALPPPTVAGVTSR